MRVLVLGVLFFFLSYFVPPPLVLADILLDWILIYGYGYCSDCPWDEEEGS